jgi:maltose alpha-D-glucosyltransferase/alpha-amylase
MASKPRPFDGLAAWLAAQRWFAGKRHRIEAVAVDDVIVLEGWLLAVATVRLDDGGVQRYAVPLREGPDLADALDDPGFCRVLATLMARGGRVTGDKGELRGAATAVFPPDLSPTADVRRLEGEQSNTSLVLGGRLVLKLFRRLAPGLNPELEITRFLTERTRFRSTPRLAGWLEYRPREEAPTTLAVLQELVPDARDGWRWILAQLAGALDALSSVGPDDTARLREAAATSLDGLRRLGERTGELHRALASDPRDPAFAPEPILAEDVTGWAADVARQVEEAQRVLEARALPVVPPPAFGLAPLVGRVKIRHHGDYHLGQTLRVEARRDFAIIDFEGEPLRPLDVRRRKHAALRDVAGMLRSLDYAAVTAAGGVGPEATPGPIARRAEAWEREARQAFTAGYRNATVGASFVPETEADFARVVSVFEVEKAAYEIVYEANHRPEWIAIPVRGFTRAVADLAAPR